MTAYKDLEKLAELQNKYHLEIQRIDGLRAEAEKSLQAAEKEYRDAFKAAQKTYNDEVAKLEVE